MGTCNQKDSICFPQNPRPSLLLPPPPPLPPSVPVISAAISGGIRNPNLCLCCSRSVEQSRAEMVWQRQWHAVPSGADSNRILVDFTTKFYCTVHYCTYCCRALTVDTVLYSYFVIVTYEYCTYCMYMSPCVTWRLSVVCGLLLEGGLLGYRTRYRRSSIYLRVQYSTVQYSQSAIFLRSLMIRELSDLQALIASLQ